MTENPSLSPEQASALFDVLTHRETYNEIEDFKFPGAIYKYGPPFQENTRKSQSPILQLLLSRFVLKLPGLRDVDPAFWKTRVSDLIQELSDAELSESYDKGFLGVRKTLATAVSALIEYLARGCLGGFTRKDVQVSRQYDTLKPGDVIQAFPDFLQQTIHGNMIDELFEKTAETNDLSQHATLVQAFHEFVVVNLASFIHYALVLSPEGPTMLRLIDNVHKLAPYMLLRQALKVGNVATMISGVMRIILAKVSVGSFTNMLGLSSGADEGQNLLQQIISQVLGWDKRELKKRSDKLEKDKSGPPRAVRDELRDWITRSRTEHQECRARSREQNMSLVAIIMALSSVDSAEMSDEQHAKALEYLSLNLAIRDRTEIVRVMCRRNPDHLTQAIRECVDAYTPMIRHVHQAVNLSDTVWDFERFVTDMITVAKPSPAQKKGDQPAPASVEDFVDLLHRHQSSCHTFLHQVAKHGKEVTKWWQDYVHDAAAQFRGEATTANSVVPTSATDGAVKAALDSAFSALSHADREAVRRELAAHRTFLDTLRAASHARIAAVIERKGSTPFGPGAFLVRWQNLLDGTPITPALAHGPVRYGGSGSVKDEARKDVDGSGGDDVGAAQAEKVVEDRTPAPPDMSATTRLLGPVFRALIGGT